MEVVTRPPTEVENSLVVSQLSLYPTAESRPESTQPDWVPQDTDDFHAACMTRKFADLLYEQLSLHSNTTASLEAVFFPSSPDIMDKLIPDPGSSASIQLNARKRTCAVLSLWRDFERLF